MKLKKEEIQLELKNPRYPDRELKERISEIILYARYAGIDLELLRPAISKAQLEEGNLGSDMRYGGKLKLTLDSQSLSNFEQVVSMYPVFNSWNIKLPAKLAKKQASSGLDSEIKKSKAKSALGTSSTKKDKVKKTVLTKKKEKEMATAKKRPAAKKKTAAKRRPVAKKKTAAKRRPVAKKKTVAKKRPVAKKKTAAKRR